MMNEFVHFMPLGFPTPKCSMVGGSYVPIPTEYTDKLKEVTCPDCLQVFEVYRKAEAAVNEFKPDYEFDPKLNLEMWQEYILVAFENAIEKQGISRNELAEKMGYAAYLVNWLLDEHCGMNMDDIIVMACALKLRLNITLKEADDES